MCENCNNRAVQEEIQMVDPWAAKVDLEFAAEQLKNVKVVMGLDKTPVEVVETLEGEIWLLSEEDCEYISQNYEIVFKDGKMGIQKNKVEGVVKEFVIDWTKIYPTVRYGSDDILDQIRKSYNVRSY